MGKDDQNVKDAGDEEGKGRCDEGSKESTGGRRSKRDRRSRRKTNSECSPTPRPSITSDPGITDDRQAEEQARTASVGENHQSSSVEDGSSHLEGKSSPRPNYKREDSILSVGGKPKVVVPSPKGIPKPIPRAKNRESAALKQNRDSVASNDSFNEPPLPLNPASAQQLAKGAAETEMLALFSTRRSTVGEGDMQVETEEFKRAVDRFDQLYQEEENTVVTSSSKQETEELTTLVTKRQKKNKKKNTESRTESVSVEEQESTQVSQDKEWKQIKKGRSFEESPESEEKEEKK